MEVLEVIELNKSFGEKIILKDVDFHCSQGEIIGVFGRNGSGKSTLLKTVFGSLKADSILIKINSKAISQNQIIPSKKIAYLPQDTFLPKGQKVRDIIPFFFPEGQDQDKIFYAPRVSNFEKTKVGALSMGELRYLELLIISNLPHSFLLLDEPFSMIEPLYKEVIKDLLIQLKKTKGIILTDHYYNDVLGITDRNFILKDAKKIEVHSMTDLVKHEYLKAE